MPHLLTEPAPYNLTHIVYGFMPHWRAGYTDELRLDLCSHVAWFGIEIDSQGYVDERRGWPDDWLRLKQDVQKSGTNFDLTVTCFDWSGKKVHSLLANPENRTKAIQTILEESKGCDGVNIDFERPGADDRELFAGFIEELADSLHAHGMTISVDVGAVNWGERFDPARLAIAADLVFIMGYDYHWSGSSSSGPVAPLEGESYNVTRSVDYYIEESGSLAGRLVLGLPYYGYDWPTKDTTPYSQTLATGTAYIYSSAITRGEEHGVRWYEPTSTPWYHYTSEEQIRQCWFDDTSSLKLKHRLIKDKNLAGIGIWALTYDYGRDELWELLAREFSTGIREKTKIDAGSLLGISQVLTRRKLARFLRKNPGFEIYDINGRRLDDPIRGVIFLKGEGVVTKVVVTR